MTYINFKIVMFKCNWVDNVRSVRENEFGFRFVNLNCIGHKANSFILASHANTQVFLLKIQVRL